MGIPILVRRHPYIETVPRMLKCVFPRHSPLKYKRLNNQRKSPERSIILQSSETFVVLVPFIFDISLQSPSLYIISPVPIVSVLIHNVANI